MGPELIPHLQPLCVANIPSDAWKNVNPHQIAAMNDEQCRELAWHVADVPPISLSRLSSSCLASWRQCTLLEDNAGTFSNTAGVGSDLGGFPLGCYFLTEEHVKILASNLFEAVPFECLQNFGKDAISGLSVDQVRAIPSAMFSTFNAAISGLSEESTSALSFEQASALTPLAVGALSACVFPIRSCVFLLSDQVSVRSNQLLALVRNQGTKLIIGWEYTQLAQVPIPTVVIFKQLVVAEPSLLTGLAVDLPADGFAKCSWLRMYFSRPNGRVLSTRETLGQFPVSTLAGLGAQHAPVMDEWIWAVLSRGQTPFLLPDFIAAATESQFLNITDQALHFLRSDVWVAIRPVILSRLSPAQVRMIPFDAFWRMRCVQLRAFRAQQFSLSSDYVKDACMRVRALLLLLRCQSF